MGTSETKPFFYFGKWVILRMMIYAVKLLYYGGFRGDGNLGFFGRSPSASRIRAKILYATSKAGLRRVLDGISYELQATDPTEMGMDVIKDRAK